VAEWDGKPDEQALAAARLPKSARELIEDTEFVKRYLVDLALGLEAAIMVLTPRRIVIGGGISKAGGRLSAPLRQEFGRQAASWSAARTDVVPAALGGGQ
jgi:glucokinase